MAGTHEDGRNKIRPIDDMTASGVNAATRPREKLVYDTLDKCFSVIEAFHERVPVAHILRRSRVLIVSCAPASGRQGAV